MNADALVAQWCRHAIAARGDHAGCRQRHVRGLLADPTYGTTARRIAAEIAAMPAPEAVVSVLLDYAAENAHLVGSRTVA